MQPQFLISFAMWLEKSALGSFVDHSAHIWYVCEILHFLGLALLVGAVGLFDLRMLGVAKNLPVGPLHQLLPLGVAGFALCVISGVVFVAGEPVAFLLRGVFQLKMLFVLLAGINVLVFYLFMFRGVEALGPGDDAPAAAKAVAAISLLLWYGVIYWGRYMGVAA